LVEIINEKWLYITNYEDRKENGTIIKDTVDWGKLVLCWKIEENIKL